MENRQAAGGSVPPHHRVTLVTRELSLQEMDHALSAPLSVWFAEALAGFTDDHFDRWLRRAHNTFALCMTSMRGHAVTAALHADYIALGRSIELEWRWSPESAPMIAAISKRIGSRTLRFLAEHSSGVSAAQAMHEGLSDALVQPVDDPVEWLRKWLGTRSIVALDSAGALVRQSRGEVGERIEFARLFSTGEPQRGLVHFLRKTPLDFSAEINLETI